MMTPSSISSLTAMMRLVTVYVAAEIAPNEVPPVAEETAPNVLADIIYRVTADDEDDCKSTIWESFFMFYL